MKAGPGSDHLGDRVLMDEYVGSRRVRMVGEVVAAEPGERIVWQMHLWRLRLPVLVTLALQTHGNNVQLRHTTTAGAPAGTPSVRLEVPDDRRHGRRLRHRSLSRVRPTIGRTGPG